MSENMSNLEGLADLERKVQNLSKLVDINSIINSTLDIVKLLTIIMENIKDIMETEASTMLLYDPDNNDLVFKVALGEAGDKLTEHYRVKIGQGIAGWVARERKSVIVNDVYDDKRFDPNFDKSTGFSTRSILCTPLLYKGKLLGVIQAINPVNRPGFDEADKNLFRVFADQAALAVQNAIFFQNALDEQRMKTELHAAQSIQESLMPEIQEEYNGIFITARSLPAREVGGEFHEFFRLNDEHIGIALGDIHEKGLAGGLRAALVNGALMALSSVKGTNAVGLMRLMNRAIPGSILSEKSISLFYGVIDILNKNLHFVNAGVAYPILVRNGMAHYLRFGKKDLQHTENTIKKITINLRKDDYFVIVTDGIINIKNRAGKLLGLKRVMASLEQVKGSPEDVINSLVLLSEQFLGGLERREDISIIAIKVM